MTRTIDSWLINANEDINPFIFFFFCILRKAIAMNVILLLRCPCIKLPIRYSDVISYPNRSLLTFQFRAMQNHFFFCFLVEKKNCWKINANGCRFYQRNFRNIFFCRALPHKYEYKKNIDDKLQIEDLNLRLPTYDKFNFKIIW